MLTLRTIPRRRSYFAPETFSALIALRKSGNAQSHELETAISQTLALRNPIVVASGRIGLRLLLETSRLERGSEILIPGYTFGLLFPAIRASGFVPVPVDIDPDSFLMDPTKAEAAVTSRTGALIATHLFGEPCDIVRLDEIARRRGLLMIEDCAQALGARSRGVSVGVTGDAGFASFDISKPLQGIRGGVVFSSDAAWMDRVRERVQASGPPARNPLPEIATGYLGHALVQSFLWRAPMILFSFDATQKMILKIYRSGESSENAPGMAAEIGCAALPDLLAGMVRLNLPNLEQRLEQRRAVRAVYRELLDSTLSFQRVEPGDEGSVHMVVAKAPCDILHLRRMLAIRGIDIAAGAEIADDCLGKRGSVVEKVFENAIALPIHCEMKESDARAVAKAVKTCIGNIPHVRGKKESMR
jgi:dTDP-4-amino-4,6-dideoxygalactose transaminase